MHIRVILGRRSVTRPRSLGIFLEGPGAVVPIVDLSMPAMNGLIAEREIAERRKSDGRAAPAVAAADTAQKRRQHSPPSTTDAT
jgi:CheY-like chemotaxis protein